MTLLNKKKIFFVTGSRAEFGQFEKFLQKLSHQKKWDLSLIITGSFSFLISSSNAPSRTIKIRTTVPKTGITLSKKPKSVKP